MKKKRRRRVPEVPSTQELDMGLVSKLVRSHEELAESARDRERSEASLRRRALLRGIYPGIRVEGLDRLERDQRVLVSLLAKLRQRGLLRLWEESVRAVDR